jgi:hypothetical protein
LAEQTLPLGHDVVDGLLGAVTDDEGMHWLGRLDKPTGEISQDLPIEPSEIGTLLNLLACLPAGDGAEKVVEAKATMAESAPMTDEERAGYAIYELGRLAEDLERVERVITRIRVSLIREHQRKNPGGFYRGERELLEVKIEAHPLMIAAAKRREEIEGRVEEVIAGDSGE